MTRKHHLAKITWTLSGVCLFLVTLFSCSYDYFVDENNFWLFVPEIRSKEIPDFFIAVHGTDGKHKRTLHVRDFSDDVLFLEDGVLRFKLPPGESYITCFSGVAGMNISEGLPFEESALVLPLQEGEETTYLPGKDVRQVSDSVYILPIGHPDAQKQYTLNIDKGKNIQATIANEFQDLPSSVTRVDIYYRGLATKLKFDGLFAVSTPDDCILASYTPSASRTGTQIHEDYVLPSAGIRQNGTNGQMSPLKLDVYFYNGDIVVAHFSDEISDPVDEAGNVIPGPVYLKPKQKIKFIYKGFSVIAVKLIGWGDIGEGEVTPM